MGVGDILATDVEAEVGVITGVVVVSANFVTDGVSESELEANCGEVKVETTLDAEVCTVIEVDGTVTLGLNVVAGL